MSLREQFQARMSARAPKAPARSPYYSPFFRNENQMNNPRWSPLLDRMWQIENEQTPPYQTTPQAPAIPSDDPAMNREMEFMKEGRFDDARAYQTADASGSFAQRAAGAGLDMNVTQAQRSGQALRLLQAESVLRELEGQGTRTGQRALEVLPDGIENLLISEDYGRFKQARDAFAEAAMRADTGATINESEWPRIIRNLMPQPGDGPERLAQRRAMREVFIQSLMASSGEAASIMPEIGEPVVPIDIGSPAEMSDEDLLRALGQ